MRCFTQTSLLVGPFSVCLTQLDAWGWGAVGHTQPGSFQTDSESLSAVEWEGGEVVRLPGCIVPLDGRDQTAGWAGLEEARSPRREGGH